jgi:hypothetical protein
MSQWGHDNGRVSRRYRLQRRCPSWLGHLRAITGAPAPASTNRKITSLSLSPGPRMALKRSATVRSNQTWRSPLVGLVLVAHAASRERGGDRVEGGLRDRDADHGRFRREPMDTTLAAVSVSLVMKRSSTGRAGASRLPTRRLGRRRFSGPRAAGKCEWSFGENPA